MKLKTLLIILFLSQMSLAQDTIIMHDQQIIIAKISEITPTQIKYKRYDMLSGPDYVVENYGLDILRYYLVSIFPENKDCLHKILSYFNQTDHEAIDRFPVVPVKSGA